MTAIAGSGKDITIKYTLGKDYMLHMEFLASGMEGLFSPNYNMMDVNWSDRCRQQEKGFTFENQHTCLTYHDVDGGTDELSSTGEKLTKSLRKESIGWHLKTSSFPLL